MKTYGRSYTLGKQCCRYSYQKTVFSYNEKSKDQLHYTSKSSTQESLFCYSHSTSCNRSGRHHAVFNRTWTKTDFINGYAFHLHLTFPPLSGTALFIFQWFWGWLKMALTHMQATSVYMCCGRRL